MTYSRTWIWLGIFGSLLFFVGGLTNVVKVFKMQRNRGMRLEKLRGGTQEQLVQEREGQIPIILEEQRRRKQVEEVKSTIAGTTTAPTPYKDVLVGPS